MNQKTQPENKILKVFADNEKNAKQEQSREKIKKYLTQPEPKIKYIICFTPRSGSSWLTEMLTKTGILGIPEEWFNPDHLSGILDNGYPCLDPIEYLNCIEKSQITANQVFGVEYSFFQYELFCQTLNSIESNSSSHLLSWDKFKPLYLYRLDLVGQAVSLYRAVEIDMFHATQKDASEKAAINIDYSDERIWYWIIHILQQEFGWQQIFRENNIEPFSFTYEEMWSNPNLMKLRIINYILGDLTQVTDIQHNLSYEHNKIANEKSNQIIIQFYQNNVDKVEYCLKNRGKIPGFKIRQELGI